MAIRTTPAWFTITRIAALIALLFAILAVAVPGAPDWFLVAAVAVLAVGILIG